MLEPAAPKAADSPALHHSGTDHDENFYDSDEYDEEDEDMHLTLSLRLSLTLTLTLTVTLTLTLTTYRTRRTSTTTWTRWATMTSTRTARTGATTTICYIRRHDRRRPSPPTRLGAFACLLWKSEGVMEGKPYGKVITLAKENNFAIGVSSIFVGIFLLTPPPPASPPPLITPSIQICPQFEIWLTGRKGRAIFVLFS